MYQVSLCKQLESNKFSVGFTDLLTINVKERHFNRVVKVFDWLTRLDKSLIVVVERLS